MVSGTDASDLTGQPSDRRKLIVVVHADVVGYSRLIGLDDIGTLDRMRRLRREVIDPAIDAYGGRVVNTGGDALLMVFDSVDGAVRSALECRSGSLSLMARCLQIEPSDFA
jgi:adenylate cyclase